MRFFDVFLGRKVIDSVLVENNITGAKIKRALIREGFDPSIRVVEVSVPKPGSLPKLKRSIRPRR